MLRKGLECQRRSLLTTRGHQVEQRRFFRLNDSFVKNYGNVKPPFGFNALGEIVYYRTYSRMKPNNTRERWHETVERVVNGTFTMQEKWIKENVLGWDDGWAQAKAQEMYDRMFHMKFLAPGRGIWGMGSPITDRGLFAALNNCAFISTKDIQQDFAQPFCFTMDASMLGVGVGFDTEGANTLQIIGPDPSRETMRYVVADSREGWVDSLKLLLNSYVVKSSPRIEFDYSHIRPAGVPIKGFGGTSSGPVPLMQLHQAIREVLESHVGKPISITAIVDIMNLIGKCVVAGNVRRTAEIAFGNPFSKEYIELKDYEVNPDRANHGWASNNSIFAELGMDYTQVVERIKKNGEPGLAWLENMRNYGRMNGQIDRRDYRAAGGNPCLEQTLESHELCCLVETFPHHHENLQDYLDTLDSAFLYAKTVTLGKTHWPESNRIMLRNRRIGCSMSGIAQFIGTRSLHELREWASKGYEKIKQCDEKYSEWLAIPQSIKVTSIKPSGTVSLLAGATPGIHAPESRFYIRRVRLSNSSELLQPLREAGYHIEPAKTEENTSVVSIPIDAGEGLRTSKEMTMWEQLSLAAFLQENWADNQVSCTVTFDPDTEGDSLVHALDVFQYKLKGVSFLPRLEIGAYEQMPYESITEQEFHKMAADLKPLNLDKLYADQERRAAAASVTTSESNTIPSSDVKRKQRRNAEDGVNIGAGIPDSFCDACQVEEQQELAKNKIT